MTSAPSASARAYPLAMAAPTPWLRAWRITSMPRRRVRVARRAVSSALASSTTSTWSTNPGIDRMVRAILPASLKAGTTTATRWPAEHPGILPGVRRARYAFNDASGLTEVRSGFLPASAAERSRTVRA